MRTYTRLAFAALVATAAMTALVGLASARNLSTSNSAMRLTYSSLEFSGFITVRCAVTLEGSFHARTLAKVLESLIGHVSAARVKHPCTNGEGFAYNGTERLGGATLANSLPWHIRYAGFSGALPNITSVNYDLTGPNVAIGAAGVLCIATASPARGLAFANGTRNLGTGVVDNLVASGTIAFDAGSGGLCGASGRFGSRAEDGILTLLGNTTKLTLTLI